MTRLFRQFTAVELSLFRSHVRPLGVPMPLGTNRAKSLAPSFLLGPNYKIEDLITLLTEPPGVLVPQGEAIENFEAQSGSGEEGSSVIGVRVINVTSSPNPESIPFTSSPENVEWSKETKATTKALKRSPVLKATLEMQESLNTMSSNITKLTSY